MNHKTFGKKLSRSTDERKRLFRSLARELLLHGQIKTTLAKAKAIQPLVESLVTMAKLGTDASKRRLLSALNDRVVVLSLIDDSKTRFSNRKSGYTRILKIGTRVGDRGDSVYLSFVDERVVAEQIAPASAEKPDAKETVKSVTPVEKVKATRGRTKKNK